MKQDNQSDAPRKRPRLRIGPGIILALAISALIASQWIKTEIVNRRPQTAGPIVERQVVSSPSEEKLGPTPEVKFIIERAEKLRLTDAQLVRLRSLQSDWMRFYGPKIAQARQAAASTNDYLNSVKGRPRTSIAQIQDKAASLVALSREISSARRSAWESAVKVLTTEQAGAVEREREAYWGRMENGE